MGQTHRSAVDPGREPESTGQMTCPFVVQIRSRTGFHGSITARIAPPSAPGLLSMSSKTSALRVLERLALPSGKRGERLTTPDLLRDPEAPGTPDWFIHVPPCFNDALDLQQSRRMVHKVEHSVWTQGARFTFKTGDVLYDTPTAYESWAEGMPPLHRCIQVTAASDASSTTDRGSVSFDVLIPAPDGTRLVHASSHVLTQDGFVRFLITGEGLSPS